MIATPLQAEPNVRSAMAEGYLVKSEEAETSGGLLECFGLTHVGSSCNVSNSLWNYLGGDIVDSQAAGTNQSEHAALPQACPGLVAVPISPIALRFL
jgi:hypothetical protein